MFISRIYYKLPKAYDYLNSDVTAYEVHRDMWSFFPGVASGDAGPFLYCVQGTIIQMLSSIEPVAPDETWAVQTKLYNPSIDVNQQLFFDLKFNPSYCYMGEKKPYLLANSNKLKGPRREQYHDLMVQWFDKRKSILGFNVDSLEVVSVRTRIIPKPKDKYKLEEVFVRGVLTVNNLETFFDSLFKGIGRKKRNGCGLLIVS